ncbi:hypothetical protein EI534_20270 [Pseudomonas frederiksbergensis]|nr:hypothetical protein [Pseudomonas frederiksbergensis]
MNADMWAGKAPVGASLLAMAAGQAMSVLDVPASSRASSLPQGSRLTGGCLRVFKAATRRDGRRRECRRR